MSGGLMTAGWLRVWPKWGSGGQATSEKPPGSGDRQPGGRVSNNLCLPHPVGPNGMRQTIFER
jgi:hypothetical protein